jgi:hypothetical protein
MVSRICYLAEGILLGLLFLLFGMPMCSSANCSYLTLLFEAAFVSRRETERSPDVEPLIFGYIMLPAES